jgi:hypothetical protein
MGSYKKCIDAQNDQACKGLVNVALGAGLQNLDSLPDRAGRRTDIISLVIRGNRIIGIYENANDRDLRRNLAKDSEH